MGKRTMTDSATRDELLLLVRDMEEVAAATYWDFFRRNMGGRAHAFIEFNGLIAKYVDICRKAAEQGIDFRHTNVHTGAPLPVEEHDLRYLAEKLECIFGPALAANPRARRVFFEALGAYDKPAGASAKLCTCKVRCEGAEGLGDGWRCALEVLRERNARAAQGQPTELSELTEASFVYPASKGEPGGQD